MTHSRNPQAYAGMLADNRLFCGVSEEETAVLLAREGVRVRYFERDAMVCGREGPLASLGILLYGRAAVKKGMQEGRMLMSVLHAGDLFGAATLFCSDEPYLADIRAETGVWALLIAESALRSIFRENARVAENYMVYLTDRIRFLSERIDGFAQPTQEERVLLYLHKNAENGCYTPTHGMSGLADALCMGRTSLYRAIDRLCSEGKIEKSGRTIRLMREEAE